MKERERGLKRLMEVVGTVHRAQVFELSDRERQRALATFRRQAGAELGDWMASMLRWAVASSIAIMAASIIWNHDAFMVNEPTAPELGNSPASIFHARMSTDIYQP